MFGCQENYSLYINMLLADIFTKLIWIGVAFLSAIECITWKSHMKKATPKIEAQLIAVLREFLTELENRHALKALAPTASLDKDLGLGSLERAELTRRLEQVFEVHLPMTTVAKANTLHDLVKTIEKAHPSNEVLSKGMQSPVAESTVDTSKVTTLVELLSTYAEYDPYRPHLFLHHELGNEDQLTYGQLFQSACRVANSLQARGLKPGETVAIMLPTSVDFFYAFFGILLSGAIPIPIYPPVQRIHIQEYVTRAANILNNAEVRFLLTFGEAKTLSTLIKSFVPSLIAVSTVEPLLAADDSLPKHQHTPDDGALIQYTSGTTGVPKGAYLTHHHLLTNIRSFGQRIQIKPTDVAVSWLPLYHDMGLIGAWLGSLYHGVPLTIMSPLTFLTRPERWLWAIHYHRGTLSGAPNFAYELCINKITDKSIENLDLSSWRIAANGAETIYPNTLRRFIKRFEPYGFDPTSFYPMYGLAESTVALAIQDHPRKPRIDRIEQAAFEKQQRAVPTTSTKNSLEFVSCGKALDEHHIRIVDKQYHPLKAREVGQIQFKGPSVMAGYYHNEEATAAIYHDGWWSSGDYGYLADNEIFITGRQKDIIIKGGRNIYPQEAESIAGEVAGVRTGCVIAFGARDPHSGTEKFILVAEIQQATDSQREKIHAAITARITATIGLSPDHVLLVPVNTVPKTSSGKLQRSMCKQRYLDAQLVKTKHPVWLQIGKLFLQRVSHHLKHLLNQLWRGLYALYIAMALAAMLLPSWLVMALLPYRAAIHFAPWMCRIMLAVTFCPIKRIKPHYLSKQQPLIYVANHASYIDSVLLLAYLPPGTTFVVKKELLKNPLFKTFITKLQHIAVDRLDLSKGITEKTNIIDALQKGRSVAIFAEGGIAYAKGLRPFKLGAFEVAAETNTAICPIAIKGSRYILRSETLLPRPGPLQMTAYPPITPKSSEWEEALRLRHAARHAIMKDCGEPAIDLSQARP